MIVAVFVSCCPEVDRIIQIRIEDLPLLVSEADKNGEDALKLVVIIINILLFCGSFLLLNTPGVLSVIQ